MITNLTEDPVLYIFLNRGLGMTAGKLAAQSAHAAVEAYIISDPDLVEIWYRGGHYTKLTLLAHDNEDIVTIQKYIEDRGFKTKLIIDEGRTEIAPHQPTALGVEVVDRNDPHVRATFSTFPLYKETIRAVIEVEK